MPQLLPGDRFELDNILPRDLSEGIIPLDPGLQSLFAHAGATVAFQSADTSVIPLRYDVQKNAFAGIDQNVGNSRLILECVSTNPLQFILKAASPLPRHADHLATPNGVQESRFAFSEGDRELLIDSSVTFARLREHEVSLMGTRLGMVAGFDDLLTLQVVRDVEPLEYQRKTVETVLRRFRGRALLADEVGLGKTIEACMVLLELVMRGLVRRVLILTPPSLVEQWQGELSRKFGLDFISFDAQEFREQGNAAWAQHDRILASFHTAKREPHCSAVIDREWDLVIIDEVHHFRNRTTQLWKLAAALKTKYMLMLTATPVQNNIEELHSLVTLIKPGLLHTAKAFHRHFTQRSDKLTPKNIDELHRLLSDVMIRNRRATTGIAFTRRIARTDTIDLTPAEREVYARVSTFVHEALRTGNALSRMSLITLQKELGSSTQAASATLRKLATEGHVDAKARKSLRELAALAGSTTAGAKLDRLVDLARQFPDQMLVFTQFRATQSAIVRRLEEEGTASVAFHGGLTRMEKEDAVRSFQQGTRIMVATDAGSEGRNLQFCNAVCNFDLPWNPMKIEQRIGRLSRIGQHRDVHVFNLVAADTLESAILHLLEAKIAMFELVVGEIDMILGTMDEDKQFEEIIADLWISSDSNAQFRNALDQLGERLLRAKEAYIAQRELDDRLFGETFGVKS